MGCGRWNRLGAVIIALVMASCGGTGGGPSDSGNQFVFTARGRLNLVIQPTDDPRKILLTATLLDPQGLPFRDTTVTLTADFSDATFIPGDDNNSAVTTDDNGQATVTLIAGLTLGRMRVLAEAPPALNLATGVTVELTDQGFISLGELGIIPAEVTFINPIVKPGDDGPMTIFNAVGGTPPYRWDHTNQDLARIEPTGIANVNETAKYTLTGPLPTDEDALALQDTVRLLDSAGGQTTSLVTVIFADCQLRADGTTVDLDGLPGQNFEIDVSNGVPPFTVTETFPGSVDVNIIVVDQNGEVIPGEVCDTLGERCLIIFSLPEDPDDIRIFDSENPARILIRDARGCTANITLTVQPAATVIVTANPSSLVGENGGDIIITARVLDPAKNQPIAGATVFFSTDRGTLNPVTAPTHADGLAQTTLTIPPGTPVGSVVTVTAEALGSTGMVTIEVEALRITVTAAPPSVSGSTGGRVTITAGVFDPSNQPIPGATVLFSTDRGTLNPVTAPTDADGLAQTTLVIPPGTPAGSVTVTAQARLGSTGMVTIAIGEAEAPTITVTADPASVVGEDGGDVTITAGVFDPSNQPIAGETVLFSTTRGTLTPTTVETDENGLAQTTLTIAPETPTGDVTVTAEALGSTGMVTISVEDEE